MATDSDFDPYYQWLGIPPSEHPINHYRLLGLALFEENGDVIAHAADRQMAHLKSFAAGPHGSDSQQLLNVLAKARLCLLNAEAKTTYDNQLRATLAQASQEPLTPPVVTPPPAIPKPHAPLLEIGISTSSPSPRKRRRKVRTLTEIFSLLVLMTMAGAVACVLAIKFTSKPPVSTTPPPNASPTLDASTNISFANNPAERTVKLTGITAGSGETQPLKVTATSSDPTIIPHPTVIYASPSATGSLKLAPMAYQTGTATIAVTVEDGGPDNDLKTVEDNATVKQTFEAMVVRLPNDNPTLNAISDLTIGNNSTKQTVNLSGISAGGNESQPLKVTATSSNPRLLPKPKVIYTSPEDSGLLKLKPIPNQTGRATITVTVEDGGLDNRLDTAGDNASSSRTFDVTVTPKRKVPIVKVPGPQQTVTNTPLQFTAANHNKISVSAPSSSSMVELTITLTQGLVTLENPNLRRLKYLGGDGQQDRFIRVQGKIWEINEALSSIEFLPATDYTGPASITIIITPPENTPQPAQATIAVNVKTLPLSPDKQLLAERIQAAKDLYADEYEQAKSDDDKSSLARKLLAHGCRPNGIPVDQFALFCEARDLSTEAGNIHTAFRAVDELSKRFKVAPLQMKLAVLQKLLARKDVRENRFQLAEAALALLNKAFHQDRFEVAEGILQIAKQASQKTGDVSIRKRASKMEKEFDVLKERFSAIEKARHQLEEDPTNPGANLVVGKYYCFRKGKWNKGLPLLAESSDAKLSNLAAEEVRGVETPVAMARLANNWWQLAVDEKEEEKLIHFHAAYWYKKALPHLTGLDKDKASQRLNELDDKTRKPGLAGRRWIERTRVLQEAGGTNASEAAVSSALQWFAAHQSPDGGWSFDHRVEACHGECMNHGNLGNVRIGATAMALLPFLGAGHTHETGMYKNEVMSGLAFLTRSMITEPGKLWEEQGTMYSQALATIALCEAYGMTRDKKLKTPAQMALGYLMKAQISADGGWRYTADSTSGDTSVTGWALMALKTGHIAKLNVKPSSATGVSNFLNSMQTGNGATYRYEAGKTESNATTAIGLLCRMHLGWNWNNEALQRGAKKIAQLGPSENDLYYNYYATQVMRHYGGGTWKKWNEEMRENLIAKQAKIGHATGSWYLPPKWGEQGGRHYCTSLATLILEVYYRNPSIYPTRAEFNENHLVNPASGRHQNDIPHPDKPAQVDGPFDQLQQASDLPRPPEATTCLLGSVARDKSAEINLRLAPPYALPNRGTRLFLHKHNSKSPGEQWSVYYATSVDHRKRKKQPGGFDDVDAVASIQLAPTGQLLFKWSPTATEEDWEKLYNYGIVLGSTQHEHFLQLRSIQTGPAIELPLANNPQKLPFEWQARIRPKDVFLEVLLDGFPPLKLVRGNPDGLSALTLVRGDGLSASPEQAIWKHSTADYVGLAISWQTQGQKTSVAVESRYMLASLRNKWVPLFSKTNPLDKRYEDSKNMLKKMTKELEKRETMVPQLKERLNQAEALPVTLKTGGISLEAKNRKDNLIALANKDIHDNNYAINNLKTNLIPAIKADLKRFPTLQHFADACEHNARVGFRLYCKAEDHKLVLYEALPNKTAH